MQNPAYDRLRALPGVGPIVASAYLAAAGNGQQFQRGRQVSAWLGLVPRQYDTGGKMRLHGISKGGDRYLRTMLIHGARVVASWAQRRPQDNRRMARWTREACDSASSDVENRLEPKKLPLEGVQNSVSAERSSEADMLIEATWDVYHHLRQCQVPVLDWMSPALRGLQHTGVKELE